MPLTHSLFIVLDMKCLAQVIVNVEQLGNTDLHLISDFSSPEMSRLACFGWLDLAWLVWFGLNMRRLVLLQLMA